MFIKTKKILKLFRLSANSPLCIIAIVYILTAKGHLEISDTEYSVRTAIAILENGDLLIEAPDHEATANFPATGIKNKVYSPYGIGLSLIFIPFALAGKAISYVSNFDQRHIIDFILSFYNISFALLGLYFFKRIIIHLGSSEKRAIVMMVALGIGTSFWKYTVTDFSEITQACCMLGVIYNITKRVDKKWLHISFWYALLFTIKLTYLIYLPLLFIYFIIDNRKFKKKIIATNFFIASTYALPAFIIIASLNHYRFNNVFESGYGDTINFSFEFMKRDWFGYLISTERGIFSFNPLGFIAIAGIIFVPCEKKAEIYIIGIVVLVWYLTMCFWSSWQGGYCWGNRLLVPIIPFLLIPLTFIPFNNFLSKLLFAATFLVSVSIQIAASFTKIHEIIEIKLRIQEVTEQSPSSQLYRGIELFFHKFKTSKAEYLASDFGVQSTEVINLTKYDTFHGFNLWFVHLLNHLGFRTLSHWAGMTVLILTILMCIALFRIQRNNTII